MSPRQSETLWRPTASSRSVRVIDNDWIDCPTGLGWRSGCGFRRTRTRGLSRRFSTPSPTGSSDGTAIGDAAWGTYFAAHGFAFARVDLRGSGDSRGILEDEYSEQEQRDNEHVIAWLAKQPWCTGSVGMIGVSWGAFAALQMAARAPRGSSAGSSRSTARTTATPTTSITSAGASPRWT